MSKFHFYQTTTRKVQVKPGQMYEGMSVDAMRQARIDKQREIIGERIKTIKNFAYDTFAGQYVPKGRAKCLDVYHNGLPKLRELGRTGGSEYEKLLTSLKFVWEKPENFREVELALTGKNL